MENKKCLKPPTSQNLKTLAPENHAMDDHFRNQTDQAISERFPMFGDVTI
jgi:hypothetical protein